MRPSGRWTTSANTASGRSASSARRCASTRTWRAGSAWQKRPRMRAPEGPPAPSSSTRKRPASSASCDAAPTTARSEKASGSGAGSADRERLHVPRAQFHLACPAAERVLQHAEEVGLAAAPGDPARLGAGEVQPVQQRRALGAGRAGRFEADADLLVQRLHQRHLAPLVARLEGGAEGGQAVVSAGRGDAVEQLDAAGDLGEHVAAQRRAAPRAGHVHLEQARQLHLRGEGAERLRHLAVAPRRVGRGRGGVQRAQAGAHLLQPRHRLRGGGVLPQPRQHRRPAPRRPSPAAPARTPGAGCRSAPPRRRRRPRARSPGPAPGRRPPPPRGGRRPRARSSAASRYSLPSTATRWWERTPPSSRDST